MNYIKNNKVIVGLIASVIALGVYTKLKLNEHIVAINAEGQQIVIQGAAWKVLLGSLTAEQQQAFAGAVNQLLTATTTK